MKTTHNGIKMFSDKNFFIGMILYAIFLTIVTIGTIVLVLTVGKGDIVECSIILAVMNVLMLLAIANCIIKVVYVIELTKDSVSFKKALRKPVTISYNDLPYVTRAYHYRSPYAKSEKLMRNYIILSQKPLLEYYIPRANGLVLSHELVKIAFTKETYDALYRILPESHKEQLVEQFSELMK